MNNLETILVDYQKRSEIIKNFLNKIDENYIGFHTIEEGLFVLKNVDGAGELTIYPKNKNDLWFYFKYNKEKDRYDIFLYDKDKEEVDSDPLAFSHSDLIERAMKEMKQKNRNLSFKDYVKSRLDIFESKPLVEHAKVYKPYIKQVKTIEDAISNHKKDGKMTVIHTSFELLDDQYQLCNYWERVFMNQLSELLNAKLFQMAS